MFNRVKLPDSPELIPLWYGLRRGLRQGISQGSFDLRVVWIAEQRFVQLIQAHSPLTHAQKRYCVVYADSDMFGVQLGCLTVLGECAPQVSRFLEIGTF